MKVSVIIPTYDRGPKLRETLQHVLQSELTGIDQLEVIVVDDGSLEPAQPLVEALPLPPKTKISCIRQTNRGAGPARNAGYRVATGDMILFTDDDILPPPALFQQHIEAHRKMPGAVIFGRCPIIPSASAASMSRYIEKRWYDGLLPDPPEFLPWQASSGNLSIMREDFADWATFYTEIPGGDDAELTIRLTRRGIPQLLATKISAPQDQDLTIEKQFSRMLHHAYGLALVARNDGTSEEMSKVLQANRAVTRQDSLPRMSRKLALSTLSALHLPSLLLQGVKIMELLRLPDIILHPCYALLLDIAYFRGIRRGIETPNA